jgi:hypothetical protein
VARATTFEERWRGLRPRSRGIGLWLEGKSVHSIGMEEDLLVVGLDRRLQVVGSTHLRPGRFLWVRGAHSTVELPIGQDLPEVGALLTWSPWPEISATGVG